MSATESKKIAILSQRIIDGSIGIIEGCRLMTSLNIEQKIRDDVDFVVIRGFDSQTDKFPIGEVRKHYDMESLKRLDKELNEYIEQFRPVIFNACKNLISKYSN